MLQGFRGDESVGDVVRAALFAGDFPEVKPPEQLGFEARIEEMLDGDFEDLDELDPKEFEDSDSEPDDRDLYEILEDEGMLGNMEDERILQGRKPGAAVPKVEPGTSQSSVPGTSTASLSPEEKLDMGELFRIVKQARKAAKMNYNALTRLQALIVKRPSLSALANIISPLGGLIPSAQPAPEAPIYVSGKTSKTITKVSGVKLVPKREIVAGKIGHKCPACGFQKPSWGAVNTHIKRDHLNEAYQCPTCGKESPSIDYIRTHKCV